MNRILIKIFLPFLAIFIISITLIKRSPAIYQPINFSHKKHISQGLECEGCHEGVKKGIHATLPSLQICINCHQSAITDSGEEEKVRAIYNQGNLYPWNRVYKLSDHVFFSHRRHVVAAAIGCERCHGNMNEQTSPPPRALFKITMDDCMDCHYKRKASVDCISCHR